MDNVKLSGLLNEAAELLADETEILTEAAKSDEGKKLVDDIKDAVKEKDESKLKKAIAKFKLWYTMPDPDGKGEKIRTLLTVIHVLLAAFIVPGTFAISTAGAIVNDNKVKYIITAVASLIAFIGLAKAIDSMEKVTEEYIDEYLDKFDKKVKELKKHLEDYEGDKTSKEYKAIAKAYKYAVEYYDFLKQRKDEIVKNQNLKTAKEELKEAKKSKDKQEIAEKKAKYKAAKSLVESALEILSESSESLHEGAVKSDHKRKQNTKRIIDKFEESIKIAREAGVPEDKILKSKEEIDKYFMGKE